MMALAVQASRFLRNWYLNVYVFGNFFLQILQSYSTLYIFGHHCIALFNYIRKGQINQKHCMRFESLQYCFYTKFSEIKLYDQF